MNYISQRKVHLVIYFYLYGTCNISEWETSVLPSTTQPITGSWAEENGKERSGGGGRRRSTVKRSTYRRRPSVKHNFLGSRSQISTAKGKTLNNKYTTIANYPNHRSITLKARFIQRRGILSIISSWTPSIFPFLCLGAKNAPCMFAHHSTASNRMNSLMLICHKSFSIRIIGELWRYTLAEAIWQQEYCAFKNHFWKIYFSRQLWAPFE